MTAQKGLFITLEGGEGAGKSSQLKHLHSFLTDNGYKVLLTREPGGTAGAEAIRHVILSGAVEALGAEMETLLFAAARADHMENVIEPALEKGYIVICDRFIDSTRVYQGAGGKVDQDLIHGLEVVACGKVWPDMTLILDLPTEEGMRRAGKRRGKNSEPDRFEKEAMLQQELRRDAFLKIASQEPERCIVIDATGTEKQVHAKILQAVKPMLAKLKKTATKRKKK